MIRERGYFLILAVVFMLVIGVMGSLIAYLLSGRAQLSVSQQNGLKAFYMAESGLEIGARLLSMPNISGTPTRLSCAGLTGNSSVTNATIGSGKFTLTTINSSPIFNVSTLSGAITSSAVTIPVTSAAGFAPSGRVMVDRELIDYAAVSGNSLIGVTRAASTSVASSHTSGTGVSQYQCSIDSLAGIPTVTSPTYDRELQTAVQLQDGWVVGAVSGNNFVLGNWNNDTELAWDSLLVAGGSSSANLNAISMLSSADGWAVGDRASSSFIFLRWNGNTWSLVTLAGSCSGQHLTGVSMVSSQQGFTVGDRYKPNCGGGNLYRYTILRWNGSAWSLLTPSTSPNLPADASGNQNLTAIHVIDTTGNGLGNVGFAVGNSGTILQYNGTNWVANTSPTTRNLTGVYTVSTSEAWAVGANGTILKWNGSSWSTFTSPTTTQLNAISMLDTDGDGIANMGFAVGNSSLVLYYNGSSWSSTDLGSPNLFAVDIFNSKDAWAAGASGTLYHWNGSAWSTATSGTSKALNGISLVSPGQYTMSAWKQIFS